jgi:hypothetical protein
MWANRIKCQHNPGNGMLDFGARLCGNGTRLMLLSIPLRAKPL